MARPQPLGGRVWRARQLLECADRTHTTAPRHADGLANRARFAYAPFTIEVLFQPEAGGLEEQRFFHIQDEAEARVLIETRLTPKGEWALDTFLLSGGNSLPLLDPKLLHPAGVWAWVALRYDGKQITGPFPVFHRRRSLPRKLQTGR